MKVVAIICLLCFIHIHVDGQITLDSECSYPPGNDLKDENDRPIIIQGINEDQCSDECSKRPRCTHFVSSSNGCFLKHADNKQA
uniref:Apple domain-containing protein n=1 Tax=Romanomermis culicivorax TaxID=13658 RepID=A0A915JD16_ROMCU